MPPVPMWVNTEADDEHLLSFQRYAGRRVQKCPYRAPNTSSFYGLGWLKLTSYIKVKKLLFILTLLKMDRDCILRRILDFRLQVFTNDKEKCQINTHKSPIFDILSVAITF